MSPHQRVSIAVASGEAAGRGMHGELLDDQPMQQVVPGAHHGGDLLADAELTQHPGVHRAVSAHRDLGVVAGEDQLQVGRHGVQAAQGHGVHRGRDRAAARDGQAPQGSRAHVSHRAHAVALPFPSAAGTDHPQCCGCRSRGPAPSCRRPLDRGRSPSSGLAGGSPRAAHSMALPWRVRPESVWESGAGLVPRGRRSTVTRRSVASAGQRAYR